ncbi:MAG: hypothetical protein OSA40_06530 [Phycisphaerales bacterium]|nr:hypothetical protein [Phycisphaerales bacterium]
MSAAEDPRVPDADRQLADDLLMDAILQGHHLDQRGALEGRIQRVMVDVETPASRPRTSRRLHQGLSHRLTGRAWGTAIAAAVLLAAGLTTMLTISTTPTAVASLDQTLRLIELEDLTFRLELAKEQTAGSRAIDRRLPRNRRPSRRSGRSAPPIEHLNGAALHVRGPKYVLLGDRDRRRGLAKGFDGESHWSNSPPEPRKQDESGNRNPLLDELFEFITLDVHELVRDLRAGYDLKIIEIIGIEPESNPDGVDRQLVHHRAERRDGAKSRLPLQIDLWTDADTGRLEALDCRGVRLRGPNDTYEISLTLESDAPLPDTWFDRQSHLPESERGGQRPRNNTGPRLSDPFHPPFPPFPPPHPPEKNDDRNRRRPTQDP